MKKIILIFMIFVLNGMLWAKKPVHVIITAGQSNTDGRVSNMDLPSYIKALSRDTVTFSEGAYKYCKIAQNRTDGRFIPFWPRCTQKLKSDKWAYDAVTYYRLEQFLRKDFYVIKWAIGGTAIAPQQNSRGVYWSADSAWLSQHKASGQGGQSLLLSLIENIDACIDQTLSRIREGYQIDAFLWHQGESDKGRGSEYYANLKTLVTYVRQYLTRKTGKDYSELPFILGTVSRFNKSYDGEVENGMRRLAAEDPNVFLIDMSEGELQKDRLHFTATSAEYLGQQMFECMKKRLKNKTR